MNTCIGLDVGRSAVKVICVYGDNQRLDISFPSAYAKAIQVSAFAAQSAELDTVVVNDVSYFVGETAISQTKDDMISGLSDEWVFGVSHIALILSAVKRLKAAGVPDVDTALLCVGLPARTHASQLNEYRNTLAGYLPRSEIKVIPQSMGPYFAMMFQPNGQERPDFATQSWAIVEVGQFTTDFAKIERGVAIQHGFGSCEGMSVAVQNLRAAVIAKKIKSDITLVGATELMINPKLMSYGKEIDLTDLVKTSVAPLGEIIANTAQSIFGADLGSLNGICLAGGGASLIRDAIAARWSKTSYGADIPPEFIFVPENSRFAVAEGFCRFGLAVNLARNAAAKAATAPSAPLPDTTVYPKSTKPEMAGA